MSIEHPDDRQPFDEAIDRAWRSASSEQPSLRVDTAILAEARKHRSHFSSWRPLAAAAAVGGLAFLLVQLMPRERSVEPPIRIGPAAPEAAGAERAAAASPATQPTPRASATQSIEAPAPTPAPAPAVAPAAAAPSAPGAASAPPSRATAAAKESAAVPAAQDDLAAAAPAGIQANEARAADRTGRDVAPDPQQWAERIGSMHAAGDLDDATRELRAFRKAYANADRYLPEELRAWASSVN